MKDFHIDAYQYMLKRGALYIAHSKDEPNKNMIFLAYGYMILKDYSSHDDTWIFNIFKTLEDEYIRKL